ncbi:MAG: MFS transporter [Candidatus Eremiobacteraeota bacterium]|nr:MFS transporter [Candidatus Eremiobacteraeota bacterium]
MVCDSNAEPLKTRDGVRTNVPHRLDRLPWSRWHWTVVIALGVAWILDGLEVTIVGAIGPRLQESAGLALSAQQVGLSASTYLIGAVAGALVFGYATDRFGRKRIFLITLGCYTVATLLTGFSWNFASFAAFRFFTGIGIGGEYAAINSAIDELIPSARRGWVDLAINGTWWFGTMVGSAASLLLLDPRLLDPHLGWRLAFAGGALLAIAILFLRAWLPESPRWLVLHGRPAEAEAIVASIERRVQAESAAPLASVGEAITLVPRTRRNDFADVAEAMLRRYPLRTILALSLMVTQAFLYNAIFFTEALVLATFFHVPSQRVGLYIFPFALGNLLGPLLLGPLFDIVGRRTMIAITYVGSGLLLALTGLFFVRGSLDATTITVAWSVVFFFASAGASAAYLTVSEVFPIETRAMAIAIVYAVGTLVGGVVAPALFGTLIATRSPLAVFEGYLLGAVLMVAGGIVEVMIGVEAARRMLEHVAPPLSAVELVPPL